MNIYQENGVNKVSEEFKIKRIKSHFREFFPLGIEEESKSVMRIVDSECGKNNIFLADKDYRNAAFLASQLKTKKLNRFLSFNAQEIMDIYLGNNDTYKAISSIKTEYLFLSLGYGEIENKRMEEVLMSVIESQIADNKTVNIFIKGFSLIHSKYKTLYNDLLSKSFTVVDLNKGTRTCKLPESNSKKQHLI